MLKLSEDAHAELIAATHGHPGRHFLFLQGLPGPFFRRLAASLRAHGYRTSRVNFNGGDWWDWRGAPGATNFRGPADAFCVWLDAHIVGQGVTDIILFGDNRPLHREAIRLCRVRGIPVFVVEEGLLRPNFVSFERGGTNYASPLPRDLDALGRIVAQSGPETSMVPVASKVRRRIVEAISYYLCQTLTIPLYPHYRSHRRNPPLREALAWIRRRIRRRREVEVSRAAAAEVIGGRFFLFPMQLDGDHQIDAHSDFPDMASALDCVFHSFAAHAPQQTCLLVKMHPFDPDIDGWRAIVAAKAARFGVGGRVRFVERYDLEPLLRAAVGVVTINSTVGPLALAQSCPVFCLGRAVYDIPGVTAGCGLGDFWCDPPPVDGGNFELLCRAMRATALVNGGLHDEHALDLLVEGVTRRLTEPGWAATSIMA